MAASATPINGSAYRIEISTDGGSTYDLVGCATSHSLSVNHSTRDTTCKSAGGWAASAEGLRDWSTSGEGLVTYSVVADTAKPNDLFDLIANRTKVNIKFTTDNTGDYEYSGEAYLESYEQEAPLEDNLTYSFSFKGSGALTQTAVS